MAKITSSQPHEMEIDEEEVAQSPTLQSPTDSPRKRKKKKSRKSKNRVSSSPDPDSNDMESSPPPGEDQSREKKRKRNSEPGQKKQKKDKHEKGENGENGDDRDESPTDDVKVEASQAEPELPASKKPRTSAANGIDDTLDDDALESDSSPETEELGLTKKGKPKKLRGSRIGGKNNMRVGFYIKEEVQKLEAFKVQFCNFHNISDHKIFDAMVQHSERDESDWPCPADVCTKTDFWSEIYALIPDRDRRSLYRFMRRHFQDSAQKPHEWTAEQDVELVQLMTLHPGKWAYVAKLLGRSDDDVTQRWKNQLEHRGKMNRGKWNEEELRGLLDNVQEIWNKVYATEGDTAGKDMYEISEKHLRWGVISDALGNVRSRQQCADKWRKVRKSVENMRAAGNPDAQFDPVASVNKPTRWSVGGSATPKSQIVVYGEDDDDEEADINKIEGEQDQLNASETPAVNNGLGIFTGASETLTQPPISEPDSDAYGEPASPSIHAPNSPPPQTSQPDNGEAGSPMNEDSSETDEDTETKEERKARERMERRKQERKERKERDRVASAVAEAAETINSPESGKKQKKSKRSKKSLDPAIAEVFADEDDPTSISPQKKKKKKDRMPIGDVSAAIEDEASAESPKKKKKSKKSRQSNGAELDNEVEEFGDDVKMEGVGVLSD
ncbi:hypothetical protein N7493_011867 [Penicillium malachiteum]|uniref:Uncharacterized protein n=1 Tax=Penicillium malachiteum TaxID=1324776 RepID=A0AAD6MQA7_9EURO|nr:hypothetical protein N7493_011867 [Penicillium malachiteum]